MDYVTVCGLEVHTELATKTKIFCNCTTEFGGEPNTHVCEICSGMPGGCNFGVRPIDQHIKGFEMLGADVDIVDGMVCAKADKLMGTSIYMDVVSVGATINIMLAAVKARGLTIIENAAKEPHIVDLANFLNSMGADVRGAGTDVIKIRGVEKMHGCT